MGNTLFSPASFDDRLEDDDFDLIEENLGVKVKRGVSVILCLCPWGCRKRPLKFRAFWGMRPLQNGLGSIREEEVAPCPWAVETRFASQIWVPVRERLVGVSRVGLGAERTSLNMFFAISLGQRNYGGKVGVRLESKHLCTSPLRP